MDIFGRPVEEVKNKKDEEMAASPKMQPWKVENMKKELPVKPKPPIAEDAKEEKMDFIDQLAYDTMVKKANRKVNAPQRVWSDSQSESTDSETER